MRNRELRMRVVERSSPTAWRGVMWQRPRRRRVDWFFVAFWAYAVTINVVAWWSAIRWMAGL